MSKAKHTTGPWIANSGNQVLYEIRAIDGRPIGGSGAYFTKGDSSLIAAAPELLEALEAMMEGSEFGEITQMPGTYCWKSRAMPSHAALDKARSAIAKARGEA